MKKVDIQKKMDFICVFSSFFIFIFVIKKILQAELKGIKIIIFVETKVEFIAFRK